MAELSGQQEQEVDTGKKVQRSRNGFWFGIIILLIIAGLAGAGFFLFTQLRDRQEGLGGEVKGQMSKQLGDYQSQLAAIQSQLAALETNISNKDSHFTKTLADFSQLHNERLNSTRKELGESISQLQRQLGKTRGDWLIADAEYLLSVANERLHLVGDVNTTREALEAADQRLRESGDVGVIKVREQIAKELAALRDVSMTDVVGIYAKLQGLEAIADKLVLLLPYAGKPLASSSEIHDHADKSAENHADADKSTEEQPDADKSAESHDLLQSAMEQLEGIVTIRHTDQAVKEILTPEEAQFIHEQLRVKLEMVKIALVEHNEAIYQAGLNDAKSWLQTNFAKNDGSRALADELERLSAVKIHSQFPDISQSFKMLRDIAKLRVEADKGAATETPPVVAPTVQVPATQPPVVRPSNGPASEAGQ
ncbi:MAG: uroporphyrinogen-III C-methyltransferase [Methylovulum sp.]|nr:uroporphyrinogen-III C-methyltransferase [Methylovulum sp.]